MVGRLFPEQKTEGSNPSGDAFCFCSMLIAAYAARKLLGAVTKASITRTVPVAQWLRRVTTNHEIGGSSPSGVALLASVESATIPPTKNVRSDLPPTLPG